MSQSQDGYANIGLKRAQPTMAAHSPRRLRRRRNVVDSSPPSEATQLDPIDEANDSEDVMLDTQLQRMDDVQPDDPSIDWRQLQDGQGEMEDAELEDNDQEDAVPEPEGYVVPDEILEAEKFSVAKAKTTHKDHAVHRVYKTFLANLCSQTSTQPAESVALEGLPWIVCRDRSIGLEINLRGQRIMDLYAHALVIHAWLVVCFRIQQGLPPPDSTLVLEMGSYFVSAHAIMQDKLTATYNELRDAVEYWENRPTALGKRNPWQSESWFQHLQEPDITAYHHRNEMADAYLEALARGGKSELAAEIILKDQQTEDKPLWKYTKGDHSDLQWAIEVIVSILAAMNFEIIKALIDGSLTRKAEMFHNDVSNALEAMKDQGKDQKHTPPAIYMNSICDRTGISPTPLQWQKVCSLMFLYVSSGNESDDLASIVDQLIHPEESWPVNLAKKGLRRYTEWRTYVKDEDKYPNESHRDMVRYFATEMQARVDTEKAAGRGHTPLDAPVVEIGFSINWRRRLREHRQHRNSNYLMNLAEALFKHAYPRSFHLQQLVVYTCYKVSQCWFSEVILTQLAQGYTEGAGGFSHYPAGRSNGGAYRMTGRDDWVRFRYEAFQSGVLEAELKKIDNEAQRNLEVEKARKSDIQWLRGLDDALGTLVEWSSARTQLQQQGDNSG